MAIFNSYVSLPEGSSRMFQPHSMTLEGTFLEGLWFHSLGRCENRATPPSTLPTLPTWPPEMSPAWDFPAEPSLSSCSGSVGIPNAWFLSGKSQKTIFKMDDLGLPPWITRATPMEWKPPNPGSLISPLGQPIGSKSFSHLWRFASKKSQKVNQPTRNGGFIWFYGKIMGRYGNTLW